MSDQSTRTSSNAQLDDVEVRLLLLGPPQEVQAGLQQIHDRLRGKLCGSVRRHFPGLSADDLADLWAQTMVEFFQQVRDGTFDPDPPLVPFLMKIIFRRATDMCRRRTTNKEALAAAAQEMRDSDVGRWFDNAGRTQIQRREIFDLLQKAIGTLPSKQRAVMQEFVDGYPDTKSMELLRRLVSEKTGIEETLAAVKRALQEARRKVREFLERKGYRATDGGAQ